MSDLHFESHRDGGKCFLESLDPSGCDALVIAGDLCPSRLLVESLGGFCNLFPRVFYVAGNHEYYGSDRHKVNEAVRKVAFRHRNFTFLGNQAVSFMGGRIVGSTLWYPGTPVARKLSGFWSDFLHIRGFAKWVWDANAEAVSFLKREVRPDDVVVTHMLPSWSCVHPKWAASSTNAFFVSDMDDLILERKPKLWIHGHTHMPIDVTVGSTRVVCNPLGYVNGSPGVEFNARFDDSFTVEA